ncbi:hypothetical protein K7X08_032939 [Anisodus acutangulus]|uniref:Uncharacterized protein n=1 Tax=Anisodus acutangulus TaxID=402998 RepID=A0A9Q1M0M2_9SOLA|nr:hypothetical protein K7X08_032939 [Anisodus acutangulus]
MVIVILMTSNVYTKQGTDTPTAASNSKFVKSSFSDTTNTGNGNPTNGKPFSSFWFLDNTNKDSRQSQAPNNSSLITRPAYPSGLPEEKRGAANNLVLLSRPPKAARLNDGISIALPDASVSQTLINKLVRWSFPRTFSLPCCNKY